MLRARGLTEHLAFGRKADNPAGHPTAPPAVQLRNQGGIASTAGYNPKQQSARLGKPHALVRID